MTTIDFTVEEIREELRRIRKTIAHPSAYISLGITGGKDVVAQIYPRDIGGGPSICELAPTAREAIANAEAGWLEMRDRLNDEAIMDMARLIMTATWERGVCTMADLRLKFSGEQIEALRGLAVERANAMGAKGPFEVIDDVAKANS